MIDAKELLGSDRIEEIPAERYLELAHVQGMFEAFEDRGFHKYALTEPLLTAALDGPNSQWRGALEAAGDRLQELVDGTTDKQWQSIENADFLRAQISAHRHVYMV